MDRASMKEILRCKLQNASLLALTVNETTEQRSLMHLIQHDRPFVLLRLETHDKSCGH